MRRSHYRSTFLLYVALLLGQVVFCLVSVFLVTQPDQAPREGSDYPFLGLLVVFLAAGAARLINTLRREQIPKLRFNYAGKLLHYRTTVIMRAAVVEAGNLFCLTLVLLEGSLYPILYFCVGLVAFLYFRPRVPEVVRWYGLSEEETIRLDKDE